ncbi:MAG: S8 family serine peptidase [Bacilli bacterium]|nr:S8 family serine peptidase [Bacilli bacterium]
MKKLGFILGATCAMVVAAGSLTASHFSKQPERDARIIVEVNRNLESLKKEDVRKTQDIVYNNIKEYATSNVRLTQRYNELNNAFVMEINSNDIEKVKSVPGVASVTVDKIHWERVYNDDGYVALDGDNENQNATLSENDNISAATMKKPDGTYEGEGTLIAILDNEFHFRGKTNKTAEWHHEVYDPLPNDVAVKYDFYEMEAISGLNAKTRKYGSNEGEEGSEYLNNKVPFYFDYGGESKAYGKTGTPRYDVHSDLSYHGSHVSSITAANAPEYKGIAPYAQLALMKVFTDYNSKGIGEKIGLSNSTGAYDSVILAALEDCIRLKVDGINMSLGSDLDDFDSESITLKTLTRLSDEGILTSISAGNSGKSSFASTGAYANWGTDMVETGIMSSYANNANTMTIASGHPIQIFYENAFQIAGKNVAFEDQIVNRQGLEEDYTVEYRMKDLYSGDPLDWVYVPGFGTSADYSGLNVEGKIAVVNRGSTSFANKYEIAADKGAKALVIINNDPTASDFNFRCSFGDGFNPTMPCALVLYKDKGLFEEQRSGSFTLINKQVSDNPNKYTVSNFSTDGATYSLDLKPEITAPGDNIKGAVPEHAMTNLTQEEREAVKYKAYQYLSGTSMSAPNYAGAQALVLSQVTGPAYRSATLNKQDDISDAEKEAINAYRETVDMRLMSTADPMFDKEANPESDEVSLTSPRIQGAGMVDLDGAINTLVYLEGLDLQGNPIGKSKIALRNNPDIAKGDLKLSFLAHNESQEDKQYDVKVTVMRPALAHPNNIVTKDYNFKGEIDSVESLSGMSYFDTDIKEMAVASGSYAYKDAYKISKDVEYYASAADYEAGRKTTIKSGYYYNAATEGISWEPLPSYTAQSTKDVVIAEITGQTVTIPGGDSTVTINPYSLTDEAKNLILANYSYGCMIEGFVTLTSKDNSPDLSIPYLGFYSGTDKDAEASYVDAPVTEPFNFEKDITKVYPSDLVNDITKSLIGKDAVNFESMIVAGYAERPQKIDTDEILTNDMAFDGLPGFYKVGTNPLTNQYTDNPSNDIYLGNPESTNTMIIQQFMLRSVQENFFTIKNKADGKLVYCSALADMLFGDTAGKWALYKSHVDAGYLSAGYVGHRAYAIVPLFDEKTGEPFASGEYELEFNYQLAYNDVWVKKAYTIHIDSDAPVVKSITQYTDASGAQRVRVYFDEQKLAYGVIGYNRVEAKYDEVNQMYYLDETKEFIDNAINEMTAGGNKKLFVSATDYARGTSGCLIHAKNYDNYLEGVTMVQGPNVSFDLDFTYENGVLSFFNANGEKVDLKGTFLVNNITVDAANIANNGCGGSITTTASVLALVAVAAIAFIIIKRRKLSLKGGK